MEVYVAGHFRVFWRLVLTVMPFQIKLEVALDPILADPALIIVVLLGEGVASDRISPDNVLLVGDLRLDPFRTHRVHLVLQRYLSTVEIFFCLEGMEMLQ